MIDFNTFMSKYNEISLKEFILNYEELEENGFIGDCELRKAVEDWRSNIMDRSVHVTLWATTMAMYAYKYFTHKYFVDGES